MAWIESHDTLALHHKTQRLAEELSVSIPYVIGTLHLLWYFCLQQSWKNGDLSKYTPRAIATFCHWDKDPSMLIKALQKAGFLDGLIVHDWLDFAGRLVKDRISYIRSNGKRKKSVRKPSVLRGQPYPTVPNPTVPNSNKSKTFKKPTPEQVTEYANSIGYSLDGHRFCDSYETKGWVVGKSPMKNWKACVRTWKNNKHESNKSNGSTVPDFEKKALEEMRCKMNAKK